MSAEPYELVGIDMLAAAHALGRAGYWVIPLHHVDEWGVACSCRKGAKCLAAGKHPVKNGWQAGPPMSGADIEETWNVPNPPNIGIRTGKAAGIIVLDIDGKDGADWLDSMPDLPCAATVITGGGGMHFYFQAPETPIPCSQGRIAPGVDVRGEGGYVVAPPSISGKGPYRFPVTEVGLPFCPDWLVLLMAIKRTTAAAGTDFGGVPAEHRQAFEAACIAQWRHELVWAMDRLEEVAYLAEDEHPNGWKWEDNTRVSAYISLARLRLRGITTEFPASWPAAFVAYIKDKRHNVEPQPIPLRYALAGDDPMTEPKPWYAPPAPHLAELLDKVQAFLARFIAYPSEHALIAHTLWIAHTHLMDCWDSTPRLAALSPEPSSGKSRLLEVTELLVPRPVHAVNTTPAYLFRKVSDEAGLPTILYDEIDTVFGPKAKDNEDIRGMLNAGHRRGAVAGRCVVKGKVVETEELPAYCAVALAGLGYLPDTILSRCIVIRMRRRSPTEKVEPFRHRVHRTEGYQLRDGIASWAEQNRGSIAWPDMPEGIEDRNADAWEALLAVADKALRVADRPSLVADTDWPIRARVAAVALVADLQGDSPSLGSLLLSDLRDIFTECGLVAATSTSLVIELRGKIESPWGDGSDRALDPRRLAQRLKSYGIAPKRIRIGDATMRGYAREDFFDAWNRYLPLSPCKSATSATSATDPWLR